MDVKSKYPNGILEEQVYIGQPKGFVDPRKKDMVCRLHKALYGLKQAPKAWYERLHNCLIKVGFKGLMIKITYTPKKDQIRRLCWKKYFWMIHYLLEMMICAHIFYGNE